MRLTKLTELYVGAIKNSWSNAKYMIYKNPNKLELMDVLETSDANFVRFIVHNKILYVFSVHLLHYDVVKHLNRDANIDINYANDPPNITFFGIAKVVSGGSKLQFHDTNQDDSFPMSRNDFMKIAVQSHAEVLRKHFA